ncbi:thioredoxin domain-containing protein [Proteobacteria bacterium 005FR1]|nr:thioredoxin domain-containing protein [Proteobacteria bacterium 005FR1]
MEASYTNNNLRLATSRYLLQHKDDPVAWQPWREDVLEYARDQGKPILLSIGYSACHWCHLMARESFADPEIASLMNSQFINIKVDREERPDIDGIYQIAHQLLTGHPGGWPLTVFLCPRSRLPFLAGTYFPARPLEGQISFRDLLLRISDYYRSRGDDFVATLDRVRESFEAMAEAQQPLDADATFSRIPIERSIEELLKNADVENGGFGTAPKFPMPVYLERMLLAATATGKCQDAARRHLHRTLQAIARGDIKNRASGSFFRYASGQRWTAPCLETTLYDNALLLAVYAQSWSLLGDPALEETARGIARWALREMRLPEGPFAASVKVDAKRHLQSVDPKVLTAWNALTVRGLAVAARVFCDREYLQAAQASMDFIQDKLWVNQRLYTAWQQGCAKVRAYLDDYVFTMDALLELLQVEWRDRDYRFLGLLAEGLINNFEDTAQGGMFFTAHDAEALIFRSKPFQDGVLPSGNGVAAKVLCRLGHLAGEPRYVNAARRILLNGWASALRQPAEHHSLLQALEEHLQLPPQVLLKGDASMEVWRRAIQERFGQRVQCYRVPNDSDVHPPEFFLLDEGEGVICGPDGCLPPQQNLADLSAQLAVVLAGESLPALV